VCENIEIIDLMTLSAQQAFGFACPAFLPQKATVAQILSHVYSTDGTQLLELP
jgi:hypothetical protein